MKKYNLLTENDILPGHGYMAIVRSSSGEIEADFMFRDMYGQWHDKDKEILCVVNESIISNLFTEKPSRALEIIEGGFIEDGKYNDLLKEYNSSIRPLLEKSFKKYKKDAERRASELGELSLAEAEAQNKIMFKRARYIVIRNDGAVFCGLARSYQFKLMDDLGDTAIKTYLSDKKAKSSFLSSWYDAEPEDFDTGKYKVMKVYEVLVDGTD